jgi:hypothetical protein
MAFVDILDLLFDDRFEDFFCLEDIEFFKRKINRMLTLKKKIAFIVHLDAGEQDHSL